MFDACQHGFIGMTCPQCRGQVPVDMDDEPGDVHVDMTRIIDAAVGRLERTGDREARQYKRELDRGFA